MTGHKSAINALGVYVSRSKDNLNHPKQETLGELIKRKTNKSLGIVSDAELEDATPAAVVSHTRRRADKDKIAGMLYEVKPDVLLGGVLLISYQNQYRAQSVKMISIILKNLRRTVIS